MGFIGKTQKVIILCFSDLVGVSMAPQTNIINVCRHQDTPKSSRTNPDLSDNYDFWSSESFRNRQFRTIGNRQGPTTIEDLFKIVLNILDMRSKSSRKHEIEVLEDFVKDGTRKISKIHLFLC